MNKELLDLKDYMFTTDNINRYSKHTRQINLRPKQKRAPSINTETNVKENVMPKLELTPKKQKKETTYKPRQTDTLFWCFYILKYGLSNYEMEINNQYFAVEKREKFKYIDMIRKNKELIKLHKIKPFTELEDDLANKSSITIKTFFALCALENINVLLVDKRKIFEFICVDIDNKHPIHIIHRNINTKEYYIEFDATAELLEKYKNTYFKMDNFDSTLKTITSYKLSELNDLCDKLNITVDKIINGKKITKKDIYELLVQNY